MSWKSDLLDRLRADSGIAALCGARVFWDERARASGGTLPSIVLQLVDPGREYTHGGADGLDGPVVQFDVFGSGPAQVEDVAAALTEALELTPGTTEQQGDTLFHPGFLSADRGWDPEDMGDGARLHRRTLDFEFYHEAV